MSLIRAAAKATFTFADLVRPGFVGPRILIYHQIGAGHGKQMDVPVEAFRLQLDYLAAGNWEVVSLGDAISSRAEPSAVRKVVLTFDDGYEDLFTNAFPLLRQQNMPFTLYLTTHPTESGTPLDGGGRSEPLNWGQIESMFDSGLMSVGVHTHTHPDLRHLDESEVDEELDVSDRLIESRLGFRPSDFAYPWGYWSEEADISVRARYSSAVLGGGPPISGDSDPLMLHRVPVQLSDGVAFFKQKLKRGLRTEEFVRRRISGYTGP
jgi:peptidoglycan/xylan/chitin deacetylase (PgdA/CDA1 family)